MRVYHCVCANLVQSNFAALLRKPALRFGLLARSNYKGRGAINEAINWAALRPLHQAKTWTDSCREPQRRPWNRGVSHIKPQSIQTARRPHTRESCFNGKRARKGSVLFSTSLPIKRNKQQCAHPCKRNVPIGVKPCFTVVMSKKRRKSFPCETTLPRSRLSWTKTSSRATGYHQRQRKRHSSTLNAVITSRTLRC